MLILHGDRHDLHKLNAPLFVPMMKEAGVRVEYREYPGYGHGFYFGGGDDRWGKGADDKVVAEVVRDVRAFLEKEIPADDRPPNAGNHQPWVTPPVRAPGVDFRTFESRAAKAQVSFHIYTPAAYGREQERQTEKTICDPAALRQHLDQVVRRGYATDNEEYLQGMLCLAGPVFDHLGKVVASVGITTLTMFHTHASMVKAHSEPVLETCRRISRTLGHRG